MAITDIERVLTVYRGIAAKDKPLATRYLHPTRYRQHNPHAADGVVGVEEWIDAQPKGDLTTVRAFQDGPYVFSHTVGDEARPFVFMDIFHFEEGLGVEHWVVWADLAVPNASGHGQTDGPTEADHGADPEVGKALVRALYDKALLPRDGVAMTRFLAGEAFIEHAPDGVDGADAFVRRLDGPQALSIKEVRFVLGQGDFVIAAAEGALGDVPYVFFDLYRVAAGKLAEHWNVSQEIPPPEERRNNNGVL